MASVSMAMPLAAAAKNRLLPPTSGAIFFKPLQLKESKPFKVSNTKAKLRRLQASLKEKAVASVTAGAVAASMAVPDIALAADSMTPSLKNFLFSIVSGGVVLVAIGGAVLAVSNFDPVRRT